MREGPLSKKGDSIADYSGAVHKRRAFLKTLGALGSAFVAVVIGVPAAGAFLTPAFRRRPRKEWTQVAKADLIDIDVPVKVDFAESTNDAWVETRALRTVWLRTEDGETFTAFSGTCPHLGCSVNFEPSRNSFVCPCHHGIFDMKTGAVLGGPPPRGLDPLPVRVNNGQVEVILKQFRSGVPERVEV